MDIPGLLQQLTAPIARTGQNIVRIATTNPAIKPLIQQYRSLPNIAREGLNPLTRAGTTTIRGGLGANALNLLRDTVLVGAAEKFLPKEGQELLNTGLAAEALVQIGRFNPYVAAAYYGLLEPLPAGATEQTMIDLERKRYEQTRAEAAKEERTQAALGGPTPQPVAGNRVDASTRQTVGIRPQQTAQLQAPARQIPLTAYEAAVTTGVAPTTVPLSEFYRAQEHLGKYMEESGELQRRLKDIGGARGMSDQALMDWAQKNPALAYREMYKLEKRARDLAAAEQAGS
jgi:hypothetical protein